jgi:hypothetical protein
MPIPIGDSSAAPPRAFVDSVCIIPQEHRYLSSSAGSFCREGGFQGGAKLTADNHPRRILKSIRCRCQLLSGSGIFIGRSRLHCMLDGQPQGSWPWCCLLQMGEWVLLPGYCILTPSPDRSSIGAVVVFSDCELCQDRFQTKLLTVEVRRLGRPIKHITMRCTSPDCSKPRSILKPDRSIEVVRQHRSVMINQSNDS